MDMDLTGGYVENTDAGSEIRIDDIVMQFCVQPGTLLEVDAQIAVNAEKVASDIDITLSLQRNMEMPKLASSRAKSNGLIESLSLVYSEFVADAPANFQLLLVNASNDTVKVLAKQAQVRVKLY